MNYSNEALASRSKHGDQAATTKLWWNLQGFIDMKVSQFMRYVHDPAIDRCDLKQSSYFALLRAIDYFDPKEKYRFTTYFSKTLQKEFNITAGFTRQQHTIVSLDAEVQASGDGEGLSLLEVLEDEAAQIPLCSIFVYDWQRESLRLILEAMELLSPQEQQFIWSMYFEGFSQDKAGRIAGYSCRQSSSAAHARIMQRLRHCSKTRQLRDLLDCCESYGYDSNLIYHAPAEMAALQNIQNEQRRERLWQKRT